MKKYFCHADLSDDVSELLQETHVFLFFFLFFFLEYFWVPYNKRNKIKANKSL